MAALSQNEAAERLGISRGMLTRLVEYGIFSPSVKITWGTRESLHFSEDDVVHATEALSRLSWLAVVTPDSWRRLTTDGLKYTLLSQRYIGISETLRPGNRIAFYVTGASAFCGIAEVASRTERRTTLWPQGAFPFRVPLSPKVILEPALGVKAKTLLSKLQFIAKKTAWEQYFRTTIRLVPPKDFDVIERAICRADDRTDAPRPAVRAAGSR
jgi:predicted RNA-binding protein